MSASSTSRTVFRTCPLCEATCGLEVQLDGDRVTRVAGDAADVFSQGFICPKGAALGELHHDPDRLSSPRIKRDGQWHDVSWEEAYQAVDAGLSRVLKAHGRDAVAVYLGNPFAHGLAGPIYGRAMIKALRSKNVYSASTVDQMAKHVTAGIMFGHTLLMPVPDVDRTDFLLMLGANPVVSNGSLWTVPDAPGRLKALVKRGGQLVVVDPKRTRTAALATEHVPIRPGTDALWLCALIHVLFREERVQLGRLAPFTDGVEDVRAAVACFTPEAVAHATGISAEITVSVARRLAEAPTAAVYGRIGTHAAAFGTLASWAADVLNVLLGHLDSPGGMMFPRPAHKPAPAVPGGRGFKLGRWRSRVRQAPEAAAELPVAALAEEIETPGEGQVRALVTMAGNPALSTPNGKRLTRALESLEFMVCVDPYLNETTRHADVILPPPSPLARGQYDLVFYGLSVRNVANWSPASVAAPGPDESEIVAKLALIMQGMGALADPAWVDGMVLQTIASQACAHPGSPAHGRKPADVIAELPSDRPGVERALDLLLRTGAYGLSLDQLEASPHGIDLGPLQSELPEALETQNGRLQLMHPLLADDLKRLEASLTDTYDGLRLIGRRHLRTNNSWMHNIERLATGKRRCTLQVHPDDAAARGLVDGALAEISSRVGALAVEVEVTDSLMPGTVSLPHGWGHAVDGSGLQVAQRYPGVNTNVLTDEAAIDPLCGTAVLNGIPVVVQAVTD